MTDSRIIRFFRKHHVLTIATAVENEPWCASCFYVYLEKENSLVFTSGTDTRHGQEFLKNSLVAGSVVLETMIIGKIRGIQFQGIISEPDGDLVGCRHGSNVPRNWIVTRVVRWNPSQGASIALS